MHLEKLLVGKGSVSAQQISDFEHIRRDERERLTIFQRPLDTIRVFLAGSAALMSYSLQYILSHTLFLYLALPAVLLWLILDRIPGPHTVAINQIEFAVEYVVWWVGLGVLSSVGLGSGLQSGMLFLFPHIMKVSMTAHTCQSLDFDSMSDMWFRSPPSMFQCPTEVDILTGVDRLVPPSSGTPVTLWGIWCKIILVCFLQSAGTAIGEIPPYWITRAARLAAIEANEGLLIGDDDSYSFGSPSGSESASSDNVTSATLPVPPTSATVADSSSRGTADQEILRGLESNSQNGILNKGKLFLTWFLRKYGFLGVLVMASFPNLAFDMCGICCGHFLMPFWTFVGATFLGKAVVRNSYQSIIYIMLCSEEYLELLIRFWQRIIPDQRLLIREWLEGARNSFKAVQVESHTLTAAAEGTGIASSSSQEQQFTRTASGASVALISAGWSMLVIVLLTTFVLSCIGHFAQYYQMQLDQQDSEKLRLRLPSKVREALVSPSTGRLQLP